MTRPKMKLGVRLSTVVQVNLQDFIRLSVVYTIGSSVYLLILRVAQPCG
jgi:hypothetical protein